MSCMDPAKVPAEGLPAADWALQFPQAVQILADVVAELISLRAEVDRLRDEVRRLRPRAA